MSALVLWRHARTDYNAVGRLQGSLDIPLGPRGQEQAAKAATRICAQYGKDLRVVSSPLQRAADTAAALSQLVGVETVVDEAFTQRSYGEWEGLTDVEVRERWPDEHARRQNGLEPRIKGWGASADVAARVAQGLRQWWDPERVTVVASHGGAIQLGVMELVGVATASRTFGKIPHGAWHELSWAESGAWHVNAYGLGAD